MNRYKETFETWNKLAALYQDRFMELDLYNETYDFLCDLLSNENSNILELGCGPGNITKYLLGKRPDLNILGTDIAPNMIELAKRNNPLARFEVLDSRNIDQLNIKFDALICGFCIPYLSPNDCKKLITDAANILSKNGIIYISFVEGEANKSGYITGSTGDRTYFYFHTLNHINSTLNSCSFELLTTYKIEYNNSKNETDIHTILIAKKL